MSISRLISILRHAASAPASLLRSRAPAFAFEQDASGAVISRGEVEIAAPAAAVWSLLYPAGDNHRWVRRGDRIDIVDRARGLFRLTDQRLPEAPFLVQVDKAEFPSLIAVTIVGDGGAPFGAVAKSSSRYEITSKQGGCTARLVERTVFIDGLTARTMSDHSFIMSESVRVDLNRLKEEAEGVDISRDTQRA